MTVESLITGFCIWRVAQSLSMQGNDSQESRPNLHELKAKDIILSNPIALYAIMTAFLQRFRIKKLNSLSEIPDSECPSYREIARICRKEVRRNLIPIACGKPRFPTKGFPSYIARGIG